MKALTVIIGGSIVLLLAGVIFLNRGTPKVASSSTTAALSASETFFDFGTISMKNGKVNHEFQLANETDNLATIDKVYTSCMCTNALLSIGNKKFGPFGMPGHGIIPSIKALLESKSSATVNVIFDPNAHGPSGVGLMERQVFVEQPDGTKLTLGIRAMVEP